MTEIEKRLLKNQWMILEALVFIIQSSESQYKHDGFVDEIKKQIYETIYMFQETPPTD